MDVAFTHISYWLWRTKDQFNPNLALNSISDSSAGFRESDSVKLLSLSGSKIKSPSRRSRKKWQSREERRVRVDREYDLVIIPSDGGCLSCSESDDSDWSIGWMEPHASDFQCDAEEKDSSFAVLVPCYGRGLCEKREMLKSKALGAVAEHLGFSSEASDFLERWLSSLHDM